MNTNPLPINSGTPAIIQLGIISTMPIGDSNSNESLGYNEIDQKTIIYNMGGSKKKLTMCAKNVGNILFPKYKNVGDDAEDR
jgi:hypothetical protein